LDLAGFCAEGRPVNTREKIVTLAALADRLTLSSTPEAKVVLACGRFDLLSRELVEQMQSARAASSVVVAAVEPNPGPDCLLPAEARAQLAAGLASVDFVVVARATEAQSAPLRVLPAEIIEIKSDLAPRLRARFRGPARA
jgi:bifunctional ADP-heptose synthase (sugar kinase/adenylyltransferase)